MLLHFTSSSPFIIPIFVALSKLLTKAEKGLELNKAILKKREEAIVQFESDLAYKARRVCNCFSLIYFLHENGRKAKEMGL